MYKDKKKSSNQNQKVQLQLPKDMEKEIKDAFEMYDTEHKGVITRVETRNIMGNFGYNQLNAQEIENELKQFDSDFDSDYKQTFTFRNIQFILTKRWNQQNGKIAECEQIFKIFDMKNKDQVGLNEIKRVFEEYLDEAYIGDNDIIDYINEFDKDQDGCLNKEEFINSFI